MALALVEKCISEMHYLILPEAMRLRELKAQILAEAGDLNSAIETLEDMLRVCASRSLGHYQLAGYYEQVARNDDARRAYERCLELWKNADEDYPYPGLARQHLAALNER